MLNFFPHAMKMDDVRRAHQFVERWRQSSVPAERSYGGADQAHVDSGIFKGRKVAFPTSPPRGGERGSKARLSLALNEAFHGSGEASARRIQVRGHVENSQHPFSVDGGESW